MEYVGPVPPAPTGSSTDAQWQSWWAYQTVLTNTRYENEREAARVLAAARAVVADQQHVERMIAEAACALANTKLAEAQLEMAAAMSAPSPLPTKAELVFSILRDHPQATILTNGQLVSGCKSIVDAYVAAYPGAVQ